MSTPPHPFAPRLGCPLCSIVSSASSGLPTSSSSNSLASESLLPSHAHPPPSDKLVIYRDADVTAYVERKDPVSSRGHVVVAFNLHIPSIYALSSTDLPLLHNLLALSIRLLSSLPTSESPSPTHSPPPIYNIGFIAPPLKDPKLPITDHLHLHAYIGRADLAGWWRGLAFGALGWYALEDLIAEIRETTSNNRIKSAYPSPSARPISRVPSAGARTGLPNGVELSQSHSPPSSPPSQSPPLKGKARAVPALRLQPAQSAYELDGDGIGMGMAEGEDGEEGDVGAVRFRRVANGVDERLMGSPLPA